MAKGKLTSWSKPGESPPSVGVWNASLWCDPDIYRYWDGRHWWLAGVTPEEAMHSRQRPFSMQSEVRWRGLAEKPE